MKFLRAKGSALALKFQCPSPGFRPRRAPLPAAGGRRPEVRFRFRERTKAHGSRATQLPSNVRAARKWAAAAAAPAAPLRLSQWPAAWTVGRGRQCEQNNNNNNNNINRPRRH